METRKLKFNGQSVVFVKHDPAVDGLVWSFSQQDGTTGTVSAVSMEMRGPSVLKTSALLLKGPATQTFPRLGLLSDVFTRSVDSQGAITWNEQEQAGDESHALNRTQVRFVRDQMQILPVAPELSAFLKSVWGPDA